MITLLRSRELFPSFFHSNLGVSSRVQHGTCAIHTGAIHFFSNFTSYKWTCHDFIVLIIIVQEVGTTSQINFACVVIICHRIILAE
jgi:hypothetical protein